MSILCIEKPNGVVKGWFCEGRTYIIIYIVHEYTCVTQKCLKLIKSSQIHVFFSHTNTPLLNLEYVYCIDENFTCTNVARYSFDSITVQHKQLLCTNIFISTVYYG